MPSGRAAAVRAAPTPRPRPPRRPPLRLPGAGAGLLLLLWHVLEAGHGGVGSWPCSSTLGRGLGASRDCRLRLPQQRGKLPARHRSKLLPRRQGAGPLEGLAGLPPPQVSDEERTEEVIAYAETALPRPKHKKAKQRMMQRLLGVAQKVLHPEVEIYIFGSSASGFGEAFSDVDTILYVSPTTMPNVFGPEAMFHLVDTAHKAGFGVLDSRMMARVPIVTLEVRDKANNSYTCDVSLQKTLPTHNTRLLRVYADLMPELPGLVVTVKQWARHHGINWTFDGYISSYSWTLLVVYYMQVCHGLPSMHELWHKRKGIKEPFGEVTPSCPFDVRYLSHAQAKRVVQLPDRTRELGALLRGFFEFYGGGDYDWDREVVSVRVGARRHVDSPAFNTDRLTTVGVRFRNRWKVAPGFPHLNIEDPVEVYRNLNFALQEESYQRIRDTMFQTNEALRNGTKLLSILGLEALPKSSRWRAQQGRKSWVSGYLPMGKLPPCECSKCGEVFKDHMQALVHEISSACA